MTRSPIAAMWAWSPEPDPVGLADFAHEAGLREVYVSVPWQIDSAVSARLGATCRALRACGIGVAALGGAPEWADRPDDAGTWTRRALSAAAFARVHLDIEPWAHPDWTADRDRLVEGYLAAVRSVRAAAGAMPVDSDVAHFLRDIPRRGGSLLEAVLALVDRAVVMAYATNVDEVTARARPTVVAAGRLGKRCAVGVRAGPEASGPRPR